MLFGYHIWALYIVDFMKKYPQYTKYVYWFTKPWTEYMANEMGVTSKRNITGEISMWLGGKFSLFVASRALKNEKLKLI